MARRPESTTQRDACQASPSDIRPPPRLAADQPPSIPSSTCSTARLWNHSINGAMRLENSTSTMVEVNALKVPPNPALSPVMTPRSTMISLGRMSRHQMPVTSTSAIVVSSARKIGKGKCGSGK